MRSPHRAAPALCVLLLIPTLLAACGGDDGGDRADPGAGPTSPAASFPVTVGTGGNAVEIPTRPERIVSLSPTATETLYAIGAGDQVVAVDSNSDYPPEVPTTDLDALNPNVEAISGYEPDLVVMSDDPGGVADGLDRLGIPALVHPAAVTLDDTYTQIEQLGVATGRIGEAAELVSQMRADIDAIVSGLPERPEPLTYYHELDTTYYSVTSQTFIGELYGLLDMRSIADEADPESDYPQLSAEYIVDADPDVILLADAECCGVDADEVAGRPGWDQLTAVQEGRIIELDEDIASRWGPRVVDFLRTLAEQVAALVPAG